MGCWYILDKAHICKSSFLLLTLQLLAHYSLDNHAEHDFSYYTLTLLIHNISLEPFDFMYNRRLKLQITKLSEFYL